MDVRIAAHSPVSENPGMSQATRATEIPFTTRMKSPRVRTVSGRVRMRMIGRITAFTIPRSSAATTRLPQPSRRTPGTTVPAAHHPTPIDQRLLRGAVPGDGERFGARHREYQGALEAARAAYRDARAIEDHIGELEAVAQLGQREGVAARDHPVADVRLREARAQVHLRRAARVRR